MSFLKEFKDFASRGNVVDLAVGIIIGGAFQKIVSSLVADIVMPPIGKLIGGVNFTELKIKLGDIVTINIGNFLQTVFDFIIVAFAVFLLVKGINRLRRKEEPAAAPPPEATPEEKLLAEIRDLLRDRKA